MRGGNECSGAVCERGGHLWRLFPVSRPRARGFYGPLFRVEMPFNITPSRAWLLLKLRKIAQLDSHHAHARKIKKLLI